MARKKGRPPLSPDDPGKAKGSTVKIDAELSDMIGVIVSLRKKRGADKIGDDSLDKASYVDSLIRQKVISDYNHEINMIKKRSD